MTTTCVQHVMRQGPPQQDTPMTIQSSVLSHDQILVSNPPEWKTKKVFRARLSPCVPQSNITVLTISRSGGKVAHARLPPLSKLFSATLPFPKAAALPFHEHLLACGDSVFENDNVDTQKGLVELGTAELRPCTSPARRAALWRVCPPAVQSYCHSCRVFASVTSQLQQLEMQLQTTRYSQTGTFYVPHHYSGGHIVFALSVGLSFHSGSRTLEDYSSWSCGWYRFEHGPYRTKERSELLLSTLTEHLTLSDSSLLDNLDKLQGLGLGCSSSLSEYTETESDKSDNAQPEGATAMEKESLPMASSKSTSPEAVNSSVLDNGTAAKTAKVGTKHKNASNPLGPVNGVITGARVRQNTHPYQSPGEWNSQALHHNVRQSGLMQNAVEFSNNLALNMGGRSSSGASYDADNPQPLPGRPGSAGRERDGSLNPAAAKRNMVKHIPASKASDREPPPH
ncbi:hypothetical protein DPMN_164089 [Dreissena polymorpha]|uniref:Uncharacterized protein n=1 Tax=Dreissena polymorpha TaxID=45954 RepID=A0A9D4IS11_DREPO|nr:hypothetical protein DPMN_164089 [Dreissena polymorpha]